MSADSGILYDITYIEGRYPSGFFLSNSKILNKRNYDKRNYSDMKNGKPCSMWFVVCPKNYKAIEEIFGCEVPKIVKGWNLSGHQSYGNSILVATDPVEEVGAPFEMDERKRNERYEDISITDPFIFAIGYSKSGLNSMLKESGVKKNSNVGIKANH